MKGKGKKVNIKSLGFILRPSFCKEYIWEGIGTTAICLRPLIHICMNIVFFFFRKYENIPQSFRAFLWIYFGGHFYLSYDYADFFANGRPIVDFFGYDFILGNVYISRSSSPFIIQFETCQYRLIKLDLDENFMTQFSTVPVYSVW